MGEQPSVDSSNAEYLRFAAQLRDEIATSYGKLDVWIGKSGCGPEPKALVDALISAVDDPDKEVQEQRSDTLRGCVRMMLH